MKCELLNFTASKIFSEVYFPFFVNQLIQSRLSDLAPEEPAFIFSTIALDAKKKHYMTECYSTENEGWLFHC